MTALWLDPHDLCPPASHRDLGCMDRETQAEPLCQDCRAGQHDRCDGLLLPFDPLCRPCWCACVQGKHGIDPMDEEMSRG